MRIGLVIHRYGQGISGGAEVHCRLLAQRLSRWAEVEVITTAAADYSTWANTHKIGMEHDGPVLVRRFPVAWKRSPRLFDIINRATNLFGGRAPGFVERLWLLAQGPHSPALLKYIEEQGQAFDRLIFYSYLYEPTVLGLPLAGPGAAWFVPTAHDEPALRLKIMRNAFERARALAFLSPAEQELVRSRFEIGGIPQAVIGAAVEPPAGIDAQAFACKHGLGAYVVYLGRIDFYKGIPELLDFWSHPAGRPPDLKLVLAGEAKMDVPSLDSVLLPGYLDEADKWSALAGAALLIAPAPYESLNLTVLEAGVLKRPVLVNGRCAVLADYAARSGGGLAYEDASSFQAGLNRLLDPDQAAAFGQRGKDCVAREFSPAALDRALAAWLELD